MKPTITIVPGPRRENYFQVWVKKEEDTVIGKTFSEGHVFDVFNLKGSFVIQTATTHRPVEICRSGRGLKKSLQERYPGAEIICKA
jgi:hypothetical protein